MIYCMSDLHGRFDLYTRMLEKIGLGAEDTLYILGDFVDRGNEGFKIILDAADRGNVVCLMGNHDLHALILLSKINDGFRPGELEDMREYLDAWLIDGGRATLNEFKELTALDRRLVLLLMDGFKNYAEVQVGGCRFTLCHGGIGNYSPKRELSDYTTEELVYCREEYGKPKFGEQGRYLVTGHTPTACIEGATEGRIFKSHDHIAIDCGAVFDLGLGCICLDTMEEFYVK